MSSAALLLEPTSDSASKPLVGGRDDRFEREANEIAERLAWRIPSSSHDNGPLPADVRDVLEGELAYDLSPIRLHDSPDGQAAAAKLGAHALTLGHDIAFAPGAYDPATARGRRTLAHEVVHAAQQGAVQPRGGAGTRVSSSPAGVPQRTPGVDAQDSWDELIPAVAFVPDSTERRARGNEATSRFLQIPEGKRLINKLWRLAQPKQNLNFRIGVSYVDKLPAAAGTGPADGWFTPRDDSASRYDVYVKHPPPPTPGAWTLPGGTTASGIAYTHDDPESEMGTTLQHELMHVEFVRAHLAGMDYSVNPPEWGTGHKSNPLKDTDPLFLERERAANREMDALEARIHKEAAERKAQEEQKQQEEQRKRNEEEARKRPPDAPLPESKPSFAGAQVLAEGGVVGLGATRGTGIVGADLVLGRIDAMHVGARGVFLNPDHFLLGGTIGGRFFTESSPIFFDVEAGILAELTPAEGDRLTKHVAFIGGGALGHEFGTSGTRFFVKVGGFAIITDQGQAGGGASAGLGVRFQ